MTTMPWRLRARRKRSGHTAVISPYNVQQQKYDKAQKRKNEDEAKRKKNDAEIAEMRGFRGSNYDDLMEFFDILSGLSVDTPGFFQNSPFANGETFADNNLSDRQQLAEYAKYIEMVLTQGEFNSLIKFYPIYDTSGKLTYIATIDVPVAQGYVSVKFRIAKV